jgi:hypothetical protein
MKSFSVFMPKLSNSAKAPPAIVTRTAYPAHLFVKEMTLFSVTESRLLKNVL